MIDFIKSETKKIMYGCCERHAKKQMMATETVQLVLGLKIEGENIASSYTVCENYAPKLDLNFRGVLGRLDILNYEGMAAPFILSSLIKYAQKHEIDFEKVKIMCLPSTDDRGKPDVSLYLYNDSSYVETITFEDLFAPENMLIG